MALLRWNLFTYQSLWRWIDDPFLRPPISPPEQPVLPFLDSIWPKGAKTWAAKRQQGVVFGKRIRGQGREYGKSTTNAAPWLILDSIETRYSRAPRLALRTG